jgi:hypothetical protein
MRKSNVWDLPFAVLTPVLLALLLLGGAVRHMQSAAQPSAGAVNMMPASNPEPIDGEPPSNEIADFPQLD